MPNKRVDCAPSGRPLSEQLRNVKSRWPSLSDAQLRPVIRSAAARERSKARATPLCFDTPRPRGSLLSLGLKENVPNCGFVDEGRL
jgi:hypothetical protein